MPEVDSGYGFGLGEDLSFGDKRFGVDGSWAETFTVLFLPVTVFVILTMRERSENDAYRRMCIHQNRQCSVV